MARRRSGVHGTTRGDGVTGDASYRTTTSKVVINGRRYLRTSHYRLGVLSHVEPLVLLDDPPPEPSLACPKCKRLCTHGTGKPGDYVVCTGCASPLRFVVGAVLLASEAELYALDGPTSLALATAVDAVERVLAWRRRA
jgi:hypothetical protein